MSVIRLAINGYGRIGRNILRAVYEANRHHEFEIVAINDTGADLSIQRLLTQHDSVHGYFPYAVEKVEDGLKINNKLIHFYAKRDPQELPWRDLAIDIVFECTGAFTSKSRAQAHINSGAKKVLISAPCEKDIDATIVYGVNQHILNKGMTVVSNASCTTNCLAPIAKILHQAIGVEKGLMTTVHAYTNDQCLTDVYHSDPQRARSATLSMIPTKTGAALAVGLVLPELAGRLDGLSIRVPTANVSIIDLTFNTVRDTTKDEINSLIKDASKLEFKNIIAYNDQPLVSIDFNHNSHSAVFDATQTRVEGNLVKILAWYDNEWGFSNRMLDTAKALFNAN